ncbi:MAG: hypothetical protein H7039_04365 [Bryobacteraceae bacterium]|nr:hypothetical protein [Bryobacteraceae bacterium]
MDGPLPDSRLSRYMAFSRFPRTIPAFQSTRSKVLDTTYFFGATIVGAEGPSIQASLPSSPALGSRAMATKDRPDVMKGGRKHPASWQAACR